MYDYNNIKKKVNILWFQTSWIQLDNITHHLFFLLLYVLSFNTLYLFYLCMKLWTYRCSTISYERPFISIVLCVRNEKEHIRTVIQALLQQQYPEYEIVVIDDASSDGTWELVCNIKASQDRLHIYQIKDTLPGKKQALLYGLKRAKGDWIAVTDADCKPPPGWLESMLSARHKGYHFILGYSPMRTFPGWLNKMIRYETTLTAIQYFGWASAGYPYMGVGRNMVYRKEWIHERWDFLHEELPSGDDDLLIAALGNAKNTGICLEAESFVPSEPKKHFSEWWRQKVRHISTAEFYRPLHRITLGVYGASQILLLLGLPLLFTNYRSYVAGIFILRYVLLSLPGYKVFKRLNSGDLLPWFPVLDMGLSFFYLILSPQTFMRRRTGW